MKSSLDLGGPHRRHQEHVCRRLSVAYNLLAMPLTYGRTFTSSVVTGILVPRYVAFLLNSM